MFAAGFDFAAATLFCGSLIGGNCFGFHEGPPE